MLLISRCVNGQITLDFSQVRDLSELRDGVTITVTQIRNFDDGRSVRLGITAPLSVSVLRPEMKRTTPNPRRQALR